MISFVFKQSGTESRPTPVSVLDLRPWSVSKMREWFAAGLELPAESKLYVYAAISN
jgi:hypothetical protein